MKVNKILFILLFLLPSLSKGQRHDTINSTGKKIHSQIIIQMGVGWSPGFNGNINLFNAPNYPVTYNRYYSENVQFSGILPNLGGSIDYRFGMVSIGLATSYQSEDVTDQDIGLLNQITRLNMAVRLLGHFRSKNPDIDSYLGARVGLSYWTDNISNGPSSNGYYSLLFLNSPDIAVPSFQVLFGINFFTEDVFGIHFQIGIGSPYCAEAGLTFRINTGMAK